jgi:hypothetical protein
VLLAQAWCQHAVDYRTELIALAEKLTPRH